MNNLQTGGFLQIIVIIIIAIIIFSYFGIDLQQATSTPLFQRNLQFTWGVIVHVWTNYIYDPLMNLIHRDSSAPIETNGIVAP